MKTINLWVNNEGWKPFDFDAKETKQALIDRMISIGDGASIGYRASIGDGASIGYRASIGNEASIGDGASIGNEASIGDGASIGNEASIGDKEIVLKTLFITGSKHTVTWYGKDCINIGCHKMTIKEWLEKGLELAKQEGYSDEQIEEYKGYVKICKALQKTI